MLGGGFRGGSSLIDVSSALVVLCLQPSSLDALPVLRPGDVLEATIEDSDPLVRTDFIDGFSGAKARGRSFRVERHEPGAFFIELRSHFFDAYLVLRDVDGRPLLEDGDGWLSSHSRIEVAANVPGPFVVDAVAFYGRTGAFHLSVHSGVPSPVSSEERRELVIADARETVAAREKALGPDHPDTAASLDKLGWRLRGHGRLAEARPLLERALRIREAALGPDHPDTANSLDHLAWVLQDQGAYEDARPLFERALRIRETAFGPDHPDVATSLNNLAFLLRFQGAIAEAGPPLERALEIRESALGPNHRHTAMSLNNLAFLRQEQGAVDEARALFERALRIREAELGPAHPETANSLACLGALLQEQGAYEEARPLFERALQIRESSLGAAHPDTAGSLNLLASVLQDQGSYDEARPLYERALRIRESTLGPDHPTTAMTLNDLATLLKRFGAYDEARALYERALRIKESTFGQDHPTTTTALNNLASLLEALGAYDEARALVERALRIGESTRGPDHPTTATTLYNLAAMLYARGEYDEARPLSERALRIRESTYGADHPATAMSLDLLGSLHLARGAFDEARPLYERALRIREATLGREHTKTAVGLSNLAGLRREQGAVDEARTLYERALRIRERVLGPAHPDTVRSLTNLACLEFDLGATKQALARSRAALRGSAVHLERVMWSLSEAERLRFVRERELQLHLVLSLLRGRAADSSRRVGYEAVLDWKGQVARSLLRDGRREVRALPKAQRVIVERLRALQTKLSDAVYEEQIAEPAAHAERLKELRARRNELEVELARQRGRGEPRTEARDDLLALTAALPADTAAVDFLVHRWYEPATRVGDERVRAGGWTEPHLSAWVVRPGEPVAQVDLGLASTVEEAVHGFLEEMVQRRSLVVAPVETSSSPATEKNHRLRELLWEPLVVALGDARMVFVSVDSFLGTLPLETLQREDGRYLIERHAFCYLADMQSLGEALAPVDDREPTLLAAGGIDYRRRADVGEDGAADDSSVTTDARAAVSRRWRPLHAAAGEVSAIADLHLEVTDGEGTQRVLTGGEPTEERIKESVGEFSHVHFATHGFFHPEGLPSAWKKIREPDDDARELLRDTERKVVGLYPGLLSGLVFAGANAKPEAGRDNGLLTAEEITYLDLSGCDLVVLSACETALGRAEAGEGMIGLRRAFRMAGARTVIGSLWDVSDAATRELMSLFYENLWLERASKQEALRNAQLMLLEYNRERYGHALPSTWGAFVLDGAPR